MKEEVRVLIQTPKGLKWVTEYWDVDDESNDNPDEKPNDIKEFYGETNTKESCIAEMARD